MLALNEILKKTDAQEFGLVTPYLDDVQEKIIANYRSDGLELHRRAASEPEGEFLVLRSQPDEIRRMVREVAKDKPRAISIFCTNLNAAHLVPELEEETGIPIYDTITTVVWKSLQLADYDTRRVKGWGRLFSEVI